MASKAALGCPCLSLLDDCELRPMDSFDLSLDSRECPWWDDPPVWQVVESYPWDVSSGPRMTPFIGFPKPCWFLICIWILHLTNPLTKSKLSTKWDSPQTAPIVVAQPNNLRDLGWGPQFTCILGWLYPIVGGLRNGVTGLWWSLREVWTHNSINPGLVEKMTV